MANEVIAESQVYPDPAHKIGGARAHNLRVDQCIQFDEKSSSGSALLFDHSDGSSDLTTISRIISADSIVPATVDRLIYISCTYASAKELMYAIVKTGTTVTAGEFQCVRARAEGNGASAATTAIYGVHAQGIAAASSYAGTVNAAYCEAIAKGTSTVTTIRGAMIACDSEGTPTAIGTMLGAEIRAKSSVDPGTAFETLRLTAEKFGSGHAQDNYINIKSTTWTSGETVADAGIEFTCTGIITSLIETTTPCTSVIKFASTSGEGFETGSLKDSASADIKCDAYIKVMVATTPYYIPCYNTTN